MRNWGFDVAKKHHRFGDSASAPAGARALLPKMFKRYLAQGRKLAGHSPEPAAIHGFRLETKVFRYTLELFRPCYGPGLERRLAYLKEIQNHLGAISDYAATGKLIAASLPGQSPERLKLERILTRRMRRKWAEFDRYWRLTFDTPAEERRWLNYLAQRNQRARK
jgi:CHAD domain-containing protein